ncbi:MAG: hypothetical protein Ta2A_15100 [Treponemataceae bacterium]|nr:MAG: hypothetical protein Ta2A_15100 [Treponemataceae bacterium]
MDAALTLHSIRYRLNSMGKKIKVASLFVMYAAVFCAQVNAANIESVRIEGLKRTKERVVLPHFAKFIGIEENALNTDEVWAAVIDTGTLDPVAVTVTNAVLVIQVKEKWAIFPLPLVIWNSSSGWTFGGAFMDSNAFGIQDQAVIVGMGSSGAKNLMFMGMYNHRAQRLVQKTFPGWRLMGSYAKSENKYVDQNNHAYHVSENQGYMLGAAVNYPITELFSTEFGFDFRHNLTSGEFDFVLTPSASFRLTSWDGYFLNETSAAFNYEAHLQTALGFTNIFKLDAAVNVPLAKRLRFLAKTGLGLTINGNTRTQLSSSTARVNILPSDFVADNYAGAVAGLEVALWPTKFGTWAFFTTYQAVFSKGQVLRGVQFDHGVTAAVQLYLKTVTIPAVGGGVSYNVDKDYFQGFFSIGMSF